MGSLSSLLLSIILEGFSQFPYKSAFHLPENGYLPNCRLPYCTSTASCVPAPPSPVFCLELHCAVFMSAVVSCIFSSIFLCSNVVARSVQCPSCYRDMFLKGHCSELLWSLSTFIFCAVKLFSPVMALVHQMYSPCKYPQAGNPLADGLPDLLQKALNLQLCVETSFSSVGGDFFVPKGKNCSSMWLFPPGYHLLI